MKTTYTEKHIVSTQIQKFSTFDFRMFIWPLDVSALDASEISRGHQRHYSDKKIVV